MGMGFGEWATSGPVEGGERKCKPNQDGRWVSMLI